MDDKKESSKFGLGISWIIFLVVIVLSILTFIFAPLLIAIGIFVIIYLPTLLYILVYKWIDRWFASLVFSTSIWFNIVVILIPLLLGLLAYDLYGFSNEFMENPKYIVVDDNGLQFGVLYNSNLTILNNEQLLQIQNEVNTKVVDKSVIVINKKVFDSISEIKVEGVSGTLSKDEAFRILSSDTISEEDINNFVSRFGLLEGEQVNPGAISQLRQQNGITDDFIKTAVLQSLGIELFKNKGAEGLVSELKQGNIKLYPERTSVNLFIEIVPESLVSEFLPDTFTNFL